MSELFDGVDLESVLTIIIAALWFLGPKALRAIQARNKLGLAHVPAKRQQVAPAQEPDPIVNESISPAQIRAIAADLSERVTRVHTSMMAPSVVHLRVHLADCIDKPRRKLLADIDRYSHVYGAPHQRTDLDRVLAVIAVELAELDRMCSYLEYLGLQRQTSGVAWLGDADSFAESCYRPVVDFAVAQDLGLHTLHPVSLAFGTNLAIDLSFSESTLAPLILPEAFAVDLLWWPAVAHEIGHDFFHSVDGLRDSLFDGLGLMEPFHLPAAPGQWTADDVDEMFGAWLEEIFCDVIGTLILGPAFLASMTHIFAAPDQPTTVWASYGDEAYLGAHPPRNLRVLLCCQVLDYLGQQSAATDYLRQWTETHAGPEGYYLPSTNGEWIELPSALVEGKAKGLVELMLQDNLEGLEGYHLIDIPGFSYQHGEHARVLRYATKLRQGRPLRGDPRLLVAAAVIATRAAPDRAGLIRRALEASIVGLGTGERSWRRPRDVRKSGRAKRRRGGPRRIFGRDFAADFQDPRVVGQAIALGAAFAPRRRH